jgi:hypothetical protein
VPNSGPTRITSKRVLAVEGLDEKNFFDKLLRYLGISDFQIEDVGGKEKFPKRFPVLLKTPGFFTAHESPFVTHLAIIRDKDEDDAFKSIADIITGAGLAPPIKHSAFSKGNPKVGVFIMPGSKVKGTMLEDLCLKTVEDHPAMKCVNEFASCVSALEAKPKNMAKAKAQTFLAAQAEIVNSVGLGAQRGYWNFDSPALDELKQFLRYLK